MLSIPGRRILRAGVWLAVAVVVLMTAGLFVLPIYLQSRVIPRLAAGFGLTADEARVRHIGLWGADLGPIRLTAGRAPAVTLAAVQIDYSPWSLLRGRITGITLGGVALDVAATAEGLAIAGVKVTSRPSAKAESAAEFNLEDLLPIRLDRFSIVQSRVDVDCSGRRHGIAFDLRLDTAALDRGVVRGQADLSLWGNPVNIEAELNQRAGRAVLTFECRGLAMESLARFGLLPAGAEIAGSLDFKGKGTLQLNPVRLTALDLTGRMSRTRAALAGVVLQNPTNGRDDAQPAAFSVSAADAHHISFALGPLRIQGPLTAQVTAVQGTLVMDRSGRTLEARLSTLIPKQTMAGGLAWENDLPMNWRITASQGDDKGIGFKIRSTGDQPLAAGLQALRLSGQGYRAEVSGHYAAGRLVAEGSLGTGKLQFSGSGAKGTAAGAAISGTVTMAGGSDAGGSKITLRATVPKVRVQAGEAVASLARIEIEAAGRPAPAGPFRIQGRLKITAGAMQDKVHQAALKGLAVDLPLQWPPAPKSDPGRLNLGGIQLRGHGLGGLAGTLRQEGRALRMNLTHRSKLFQGLVVLINGLLEADGLHAEVRLPAYQPGQAVDLGRFAPALAGLRADGRIEARGVVDAAGGRTRGKAYLKIDQGSLTQDERLLKLDGIGMALQIDDLETLKSAPRQRLRVANLQLGELRAANLQVDFQLEDRKTLFLEKTGLQWCQGRINAGAIRIIQGKDDYDVTLFCDRLNLAMVLEQLGAAEAGGQGSVNGRIPLRWVDGRLSFDNGFLYSTPGQTGLIQLKGTEALVAGLPPGSPQQTQLDIATEALKDYTYQWAKLSVRSEKDILLLKLQLDGKPNKLLPFAYNQQLGRFERVAGKGQAEFKGISIDLNFKSPLNEIIHYREFLNRK